MGFLPITREEMKEQNMEQMDFIIVSGDAYVDHPSFGVAIISRLLEDMGFKIGIIPQPDWKTTNDFKRFGKPRYAFLVTAGNLDSMVSNYYASKKRRKYDSYSPGGRPGFRPDRATIVYCNKLREVYKDVPIIIGGIEASLRRFAHYDYWDDDVRRSILFDSRADLLIFGMAEKQMKEISERLKNGEDIKTIRDVRGTCYITSSLDDIKGDYILIPSFEEVKSEKRKFAEAFIMQYEEQDPIKGRIIVQPHGDRFMVQNPPALPLSQKEMDYIYSLPYERDYHPYYKDQGGVPAIEEVKFSIVSHRGCFGGCAFCALHFHQGRIIQNRSHASIINEAKKLRWFPDFKGYIHDVGGPTANFRNPSCKKQLKEGLCRGKHCLYPEPCKNLYIDHGDYVKLLRALREIEGIKKVFVRSGIRFDYLMADKKDEFFYELCQHHISGQLKVAPEHVSENVLRLMNKPGKEVYEAFRKKYFRINKELGKKQYLVPYFISGHPGSTLRDAIELAEYIRDMGYMPEQVQDFIPTPGSLSTCMYYTELDPRTMKKIHVPKGREKAMQRALLQYKKPENYDLVYEALVKAGRKDLIGYGRECLIRPKKLKKT